MPQPTTEQTRLLEHLQNCQRLGAAWVQRASLFYGERPFDLSELTAAIEMGWIESSQTVVRLTEIGAGALASIKGREA